MCLCVVCLARRGQSVTATSGTLMVPCCFARNCPVSVLIAGSVLYSSARPGFIVVRGLARLSTVMLVCHDAEHLIADAGVVLRLTPGFPALLFYHLPLQLNSIRLDLTSLVRPQTNSNGSLASAIVCWSCHYKLEASTTPPPSPSLLPHFPRPF